MKITQAIILKDYNKLKCLAKNALAEKKYSIAAVLMTKAATLMYESNIFYRDDELEELVLLLGKEYINVTPSAGHQAGNKRLVFYDYFVMDNRGLTEQYIEALSHSDYQVLYIACRKEDSVSSEIYKKIKGYKNFTVFHTVLDIHHIQSLYDAIREFCPQKIIAHTAPFDIYGLALMHQCLDCTKYLINITDHAFWLGCTLFDYYFEFRDYGYNVSSQLRSIDRCKLLKLPYYPNINDQIPFAGFNFNIERKKLIVSGGSTYKIEGSPIFFEIVKYILDKHDETVFLYLGNGDFTHINDFILQNHYENRFFVASELKDIYEVLCHAYLYLNTYPVNGGLMTQFACLSAIAPITLRKNAFDYEGDINELFLSSPLFPIVFTDKNELFECVDTYLDNAALYNSYRKTLKDIIISKDSFRNLLLSYLKDGKQRLVAKEYCVKTNEFMEDCIVRLRADYNIKYYRIFLTRNKMAMVYFLPYLWSFVILKLFFLVRKKILPILYHIGLG